MESAASSLTTTAWAFMQAIVSIGPEPQDWECFMMLEQLARGSFASLPARVREVYADILALLQERGLTTGEAEGWRLTPEGLSWRDAFAARFVSC